MTKKIAPKEKLIIPEPKKKKVKSLLTLEFLYPTTPIKVGISTWGKPYLAYDLSPDKNLRRFKGIVFETREVFDGFVRHVSDIYALMADEDMKNGMQKFKDNQQKLEGVQNVKTN